MTIEQDTDMIPLYNQESDIDKHIADAMECFDEHYALAMLYQNKLSGDRISFEDYCQVSDQLSQLNYHSLEHYTPDHFIGEHAQHAKLVVAQEGIMDALKETGKKILEIIKYLYDMIVQAFKYFFDDITVSKRKIQKASELIAGVSEQYDMEYKTIKNPEVAELCWIRENKVDILTSIRTLSDKYTKVSNELFNRIPKFVEDVQTTQRNITDTINNFKNNPRDLDNALFIKQWINVLTQSMYPVDPDLRDPAKITSDKESDEIIKAYKEVRVTIGKDGMYKFLSPAFPGNWRIVSYVPQNIAKKWANEWNSYTNKAFGINIKLSDSIPTHYERQGENAELLYFNDIRNIRYEFVQMHVYNKGTQVLSKEYDTLLREKYKLTGNLDKNQKEELKNKIKEFFKDIHKVDTINGLDLREAVRKIKLMINQIEKDNTRLDKIIKEANNMVKEVNNIKSKDFVGLNNTIYRSGDMFKLVVLVMMKMINKPFKDIITYVSRCIRVYTDYIYAEAKRYSDEYKDFRWRNYG